MTNFRPKMTISESETGSVYFFQHDSQEFLQYVLEGLHNEMNRSEQPKKPVNPPKPVEPSKPVEPPKPEEQNGNDEHQQNGEVRCSEFFTTKKMF
jgi:hypothetical protein